MASRLNQIGRCVLMLAILTPNLLSAQGRPQTRTGFWFNGGWTLGSAGCAGCDGRESGSSIALALGGTLSPKVLLGFSIDGWHKGEGGTAIGVAAFLARVRFYPAARGGGS